MKRFDKLIFVSGSDTSTSAMAEAILASRYMLEDILIDSKGLVVLFPEPINPKAETVLSENHLTMKEHVSEAFSEDDFDDRTLVLTMDHAQKEKVLSDYKGIKNLYTLTEYIQAEGDVEDPYGGDLEAYRQCFFRLRDLIGKLAETLDQEELRS